MTADYLISENGPLQLVHAQMRDGDNIYRSAWTYVDGFGDSVLRLREADPSAGDGGQWVASGLPERNKAGLIYRTFKPWFYTGDPKLHPIGVPRQRSVTIAYDGVGRPASVFDQVGDLLKYIYHPL
jgi:hypothetical protein